MKCRSCAPACCASVKAEHAWDTGHIWEKAVSLLYAGQGPGWHNMVLVRSISQRSRIPYLRNIIILGMYARESVLKSVEVLRHSAVCPSRSLACSTDTKFYQSTAVTTLAFSGNEL